MKLALERRSRLEESRQLWQFYWDMAEEENYIREKENILNSATIGNDLVTVNILLAKHKVSAPGLDVTHVAVLVEISEQKIIVTFYCFFELV